MENPETSSSSWGRWQPEPSGWPPFVSAEPAPAAASKKHKHRYQHETKQSACKQDNFLSYFTSFAFCFRRNCSGSSCRDLDCKAKKEFEVRRRKTRNQPAWSNTEEMTRDKHPPCVNIQPTTTAKKSSKNLNQTLVLTKQRLHSCVYIWNWNPYKRSTKSSWASNQKWCARCTLAALRRISLSCSSFRCFSNWSSCSKNLSWARTSLSCS